VIVGLGETEKEAADVIQRCVDIGVLPAIFAFTPIGGTTLEAKQPPKLESYRRVQLARHLIVNMKTRIEDMKFDVEGEIIGYGVPCEAIEATVDSGLPFRTSGCPSCNRPYYNERPSGPIYNYPKQPNKEEIEKIKTQLWQ
jgi:biotin synthase